MPTEYSMRMEQWVDDLTAENRKLLAAIKTHRESCMARDTDLWACDYVLWNTTGVKEND